MNRRRDVAAVFVSGLFPGYNSRLKERDHANFIWNPGTRLRIV
jgi:hypothetical protein